MQRRGLDFQSIDQLIAELQHLRDGEYRRAGSWTLSQVCDHLAIFFRGPLDGFTQRVPWLIRVLLGKLILRSILKKRGMRAGIKVPQSFLPGDPRQDREAADHLIAPVERFRDHTGEYQPSPLFGRLTRDQWTQLNLIHSAHHLSFLVPAEAAGSTAGPGG